MSECIVTKVVDGEESLLAVCMCIWVSAIHCEGSDIDTDDTLNWVSMCVCAVEKPIFVVVPYKFIDLSLCLFLPIFSLSGSFTLVFRVGAVSPERNAFACYVINFN